MSLDVLMQDGEEDRDAASGRTRWADEVEKDEDDREEGELPEVSETGLTSKHVEVITRALVRESERNERGGRPGASRDGKRKRKKKKRGGHAKKVDRSGLADVQTAGRIMFLENTFYETPDSAVLHYSDVTSETWAYHAAHLGRRYPHMRIYADRKEKRIADPYHWDRPGTCVLEGDGGERRHIVTLFGQMYATLPSDRNGDNPYWRDRWFREGLEHMAVNFPQVKSIAVPWGVGCGAYGGIWWKYLGTLNEFAARHPDIRVMVCMKSPAHLSAASEREFLKTNADRYVELATEARMSVMDSAIHGRCLPEMMETLVKRRHTTASYVARSGLRRRDGVRKRRRFARMRDYSEYLKAYHRSRR